MRQSRRAFDEQRAAAHALGHDAHPLAAILHAISGRIGAVAPYQALVGRTLAGEPGVVRLVAAAIIVLRDAPKTGAAIGVGAAAGGQATARAILDARANLAGRTVIIGQAPFRALRAPEDVFVTVGIPARAVTVLVALTLRLAVFAIAARASSRAGPASTAGTR